MPVLVVCECGKQLQVKDELLGKRIRCRDCDRVILVQDTGAEEAVYGVESAPETPRGDRPTPSAGHRRARGISYEIIGDDMQLVDIELEPNGTVVAEAGAMMYMEDGIEFTAKMGDGSNPNQGFFGKLMNAGKRALTGESIFLTHFTNNAPESRHVAFSAPYPGRIMPMDLSEMGGELICQKGSFLCATLGTRLDLAFQKRVGVGLFGGEGFILQRISGKGLAFVHACGAVVRRELGHETLRVDTGCLVAFSPEVDYDIEKVGSLKSMFFGGEGLFLATLTGPGTIWLQSLPFARLAGRLAGGGGGREQGSLLGGLGDMLSGD